MLHKLIKGIAPIAALALGAAVSGCDMNISIDGEEGVPLAELDTSGEAPTKLVLAGPDEVVVSEGGSLDIAVEGDTQAAELVRFTLKDGTLGVMREKGKWGNVGKAMVRVTMPALESVVIAGSGKVTAEKIEGDADITIAGSGSLDVTEVAAGKVDVTVAGSGSLEAKGSAESLDLNILGSGKADMNGLTAERADINIAGSGDAAFASDGKVEANIMGSGTVRVIGRATCEVNSMGSGKVICEAAADEPAAEEAEEVAKAEPKAKKKSASKKKRVAKKASPKKPRKA